MFKYYDRNGEQISLEEYILLHSDVDYLRVALTEIGDARISTVWLGLNHNFTDGEPLIFETMIFGGTHGEYCKRYATEEEALAGHQYACELVSNS